MQVDRMKRAVVCGAGGFIGHHLVKRLVSEGYNVRGVDIKYPEFDETYAQHFMRMDLRVPENCYRALLGWDGCDVYQLAADMGGIGYITSNLATVARNNALINLNMLEAAKQQWVPRYLYTSSACVYPQYLQEQEAVVPLQEHQAYPADPEPGYGWEKLFSEQMCEYYLRDFKLDIRIVRFHNIYGPLGTWHGGKEKSPAAICRKVALASDGGTIEVWGDGQQTRSYCYIDDCVEGVRRLMESGYQKPLNLGTDELVTVDKMVQMVAAAAGKHLAIEHVDKPQGVRGRNSDNTKLREVLGWVPETPLGEGLKTTYEWIAKQVKMSGTKLLVRG